MKALHFLKRSFRSDGPAVKPKMELDHALTLAQDVASDSTVWFRTYIIHSTCTRFCSNNIKRFCGLNVSSSESTR